APGQRAGGSPRGRGRPHLPPARAGRGHDDPALRVDGVDLAQGAGGRVPHAAAVAAESYRVVELPRRPEPGAVRALHPQHAYRRARRHAGDPADLLDGRVRLRAAALPGPLLLVRRAPLDADAAPDRDDDSDLPAL